MNLINTIVVLALLAFSEIKCNDSTANLTMKILYDRIKDQQMIKDGFESPYKLLNKKKNFILCDVKAYLNGALKSKLKKSCFSESYNFSFSAFFYNKKLLKTKNLKTLAETFGEFSTCEIKYMKYNPVTESLEYFNSSDNFLWFNNKKLNDTILKPEVSIIKDTKDENRKTVIFECPIPKSDVEMSITAVQNGYSTMQSYPMSRYRTTVSAMHVRLNFMHIESVNLHLNKYSSEDKDESVDGLTQKDIIKQSVERFLIYYDGKCKTCNVNESVHNYNPSILNAIKCNLNERTCEHDGKCYADREPYTPVKYVNEDEIKMNSYVCNPGYSQTSLFMPCAINNGGCKLGQECLFNPRTFNVTCQ